MRVGKLRQMIWVLQSVRPFGLARFRRPLFPATSHSASRCTNRLIWQRSTGECEVSVGEAYVVHFEVWIVHAHRCDTITDSLEVAREFSEPNGGTDKRQRCAARESFELAPPAGGKRTAGLHVTDWRDGLKIYKVSNGMLGTPVIKWDSSTSTNRQCRYQFQCFSACPFCIFPLLKQREWTFQFGGYHCELLLIAMCTHPAA